MKILSCITEKKEIEIFKKIGIDEIYFGLKDIPSYTDTGNLSSMSEAKEAITIAHRFGLKAYLAANKIDFNNVEMKKVLSLIGRIIDYGIDAIIVSNIGFLRRLRAEYPSIDLHLSSVQPCFNSESVKFFFDNFKISRLILPNQLAALEAKDIISFCKKNNIKTEVFYFKFFGCPYINGYCGLHQQNYFTYSIDKYEGSMCKVYSEKSNSKIIPFNIRIADKGKIIEALNKLKLRLSIGGSDRILNAASFFDYCVSGLDCIKFGTRTDSTEIKIRKLNKIKEVVADFEYLIKNYSREEAKRRFVELAMR